LAGNRGAGDNKAGLAKGRSVGFNSTRIAVAGVIILVAAIGLFPILGYYDAFGLGDWASIKGKKYWDWLDLLIVPTILVLAGVWLSFKLEEKVEDHARKLEEYAKAREDRQAEERARDAELQNYFDQMQRSLLHENLRDVENVGEARDFAEGRTKALLQDLDETRKRRLLIFLYVSHLIATPQSVVRLPGADLSSAKLQGAFLKGADLARVNLRSADLRDAILIRANLDHAFLDQADLSGANLQDAQVTSKQLKSCKPYIGATMPSRTSATSEDVTQP
jgi:hypothetical protein